MLNQGAPKPPRHLSRPAKAWWRTVTTEWDIAQDGLLVLQVALEAYDRLCQARQLVDGEGVVIVDPSGRRRAHPALAVEKEARLALLRAWRQLGLDVEPPGPVGRPPAFT
jgi:P27 family predicted phage terminase small subunit